jgi:16S rRNA (cytosine1402-N4)-methyltransferase
MLKECLEGLNIRPDGTYVDVTFGGGGHSRAIYDLLNDSGTLVAFDQDPDARANAWEAPNFHFVAANFAYIQNHLRMLGIEQVDGILADLGVSSHQFDDGSRGFSIREDAALDMRMNQHGDLTAHKVVNTYEEDDLFRVFRSYGEIQNTAKLVRTILKTRSQSPIETTGALAAIGASCAPKFKENKYNAQVFQAIRIEVNDEMDALESFLKSTEDVLKPGGRLVVMSYHSLEDRMVKNIMKRGSISGEITKDFFGNVIKPFTEVVRHPKTASEEEIEQNNRARSAKLRIAERNGK